MKKITILFLLIFVVAKIHAQVYLIKFAGTGASNTVDSVRVENLTQCTDTILRGSDTLKIITMVGINELNTDKDNAILIYPNPMSGNCYIDFYATVQGQMNLNLYSISGKRILRTQEFLLKGLHTYSLNGISSGVYFLNIESDKYSYTAKIVSCNMQSGVAEINHIETQSIDNYGIASNKEKMKSMKSIGMQYTTGDRLKLTGFSEGVYKTVCTLVPSDKSAISLISFNFVACTDADSNHYPVAQIGTQIWMAENLKTSKYSNGFAIPKVTVNSTWANLTTGAFCWYENDSAIYESIYGKLYNYYTVIDSRNLCPNGWHIPSDIEWTAMATFLGSNVGGKLKEVCSIIWGSFNAGASNETGFTALPGGYRGSNGSYSDVGYSGKWWSATSSGSNRAYFRFLLSNYTTISSSDWLNPNGFSVRCIKDL